MAKQPKNAISPTRAENYPEWYQEVIKASDLSENSEVRGCMVIKPWGYNIWENMQRILDQMFKDTGHVNAYFPLFIPLSYFEKEAEHVDGFAKECAVVTHHRLEPNAQGGLEPAGKLEEPLVVRPTSEMIIGASYAKWVQSWRDLPILINQWANVVRWEMRTRMFLRTAEFLWQEGHTAHATEQEAREETNTMLDVYADFAEEYLAIPVIKGEKPPHERFPGADVTLTIEAMMQDRKALQSGTSHFLGQNFSKAMGIKFQDENSKEQYAWTTSWGVSTRLIGGLIMAHSDDDGLVLPPKIAPKQIVILPIFKNDADREKVLDWCKKLEKELKAVTWNDRRLEVLVDKSDLRGKNWVHIKKGVPIRLEVGPRDIANDSVFMGRRDKGAKEKQSITKDEFIKSVPSILEDIQSGLLEKAKQFQRENTRKIDTWEGFESYFTPKNKNQPEIHGGFALCHWHDDPIVEEKLKTIKVTMRCIPLDAEAEEGICIFTGKPSNKRVIFAKAY